MNVGGKSHQVRWDTLDKFPTSRLGRLRHCVTHRGKKKFGLLLLYFSCRLKYNNKVQIFIIVFHISTKQITKYRTNLNVNAIVQDTVKVNSFAINNY